MTSPAPGAAPGLEVLSPRERQVALLVAEAKPNKVIAFELGLTYGTVKEYLFRIFQKLGVPNRTALAMRLSKPQTEA